MPIRLALKIALLTAAASQRQIAADSGISEHQFSEIVRVWTAPLDVDPAATAATLGKRAAELFDEAVGNDSSYRDLAKKRTAQPQADVRGAGVIVLSGELLSRLAGTSEPNSTGTTRAAT
jgi:hypothetical protein